MLNQKSELKLKPFGSIIFFLELELELFRSIFFGAGAGSFGLYLFCSELELEPQSSGGQVGAGSKSETIVHLCPIWSELLILALQTPLFN